MGQESHTIRTAVDIQPKPEDNQSEGTVETSPSKGETPCQTMQRMVSIRSAQKKPREAHEVPEGCSSLGTYGEPEFYTIQELDAFLMDTDGELEIFQDTSSEGHVSDYEATPAPLTAGIFIQPPIEVEQSPDESSESTEQPAETPKVVKVKVAELQEE